MFGTRCVPTKLLSLVLPNYTTGRKVSDLGRIPESPLCLNWQRSGQDVPSWSFLHRWCEKVDSKNLQKLRLAQPDSWLHPRNELSSVPLAKIPQRGKYFLAFCTDRWELPTARFLRWNVRSNDTRYNFSKHFEVILQNAWCIIYVRATWVPDRQLVC